MQKIILYIQPKLRNESTDQDFQILDLMEEDLITLTQVIQDAKNIDKVFTDFTQTFNLPASKTNNKIFKYWYNPDVEGFDNQQYSKARIELNHFHFKDGKIRLEEVVMKNNKPSLYKVTFFGSTVTLNDLIGEDKLNQLEWLNNFDHVNNATNVLDGLQSGLNFTVDSVTYNDAIIYPLITHSQQLLYDFAIGSPNLDHGGNISANLTNRTKRGVVPEDLKPAILVKHIIKAIEEKYSLTFKTSEFFDSAAMDNMYMWLHRKKGKMALAGTWIGNSDSYTCSGSDCAVFTSTNSNPKFNLANGIIRYVYTPIADTLSFELTIDFQVTPNTGFASVPYTIELLSASDWSSLAKDVYQTGTNTISYTFEVDEFFTGDIVGRVTSEETFEFQAQYDLDFTTIVDTDPTPTVNNFTATFTSTASNLTPQNGEVVITDQMPDMKVLDFLTTLFKMHNLTAFVNFNEEIVVQTLDDFYDGGETHNITEYIKTDEHTVTSVIPYDEIDFEYAEQKTILADAFNNTNNRKFGSLEFKSDLTTNNKFNVKADLEHILYERLINIANGDLTGIQYGFHVDSNEEPIMAKPVIFYGVYKVATGGINFVDTTRPATKNALCPAGTRTGVINFWMPHNYSSAGSTTTPPTYNLDFGSEINSYDLTDFSGVNNSLFQKYYTNYITRLYNKESRLFKFKAILPLKVLINLSLDDTVIIDTRSFTINSMKTKLQSGETELELINIINNPAEISISYSATSYCTTDIDPTPTVSPTGGTFTVS